MCNRIMVISKQLLYYKNTNRSKNNLKEKKFSCFCMEDKLRNALFLESYDFISYYKATCCNKLTNSNISCLAFHVFTKIP